MPTKGSRYLLLVVSCGAALLLLLVLLSVSGVDGSLQYVESNSQRKAHYCGAKLSDTLAKLCNRFNGFRKKSGMRGLEGILNLEHCYITTVRLHVHFAENVLMTLAGPEPHQLLDELERDIERLHTLNDRSADMIYQALVTLQHLNTHEEHNFHRVRRQVVAECCYQSCTLDTLKSYCAD